MRVLKLPNQPVRPRLDVIGRTQSNVFVLLLKSVEQQTDKVTILRHLKVLMWHEFERYVLIHEHLLLHLFFLEVYGHGIAKTRSPVQLQIIIVETIP